ncbi:MAG: hypothetical protein U5K72_05215 [Balneolaceae bacterium]|nr:hypothetical protein [Balneolaceae bacterium]
MLYVSKMQVTDRKSTTHSKLTEDEHQADVNTPDLIRIAVILESAENILGDVEQALGS